VEIVYIWFYCVAGSRDSCYIWQFFSVILTIQGAESVNDGFEFVL